MPFFNRVRNGLGFAAVAIVLSALAGEIADFTMKSAWQPSFGFSESQLHAENRTLREINPKQHLKDYTTDRLITTAMIKIIKNYYVDSDRITDAALFNFAIDGLKEDPLVEVKASKQDYSIGMFGDRYLGTIPADFDEKVLNEQLLNIAAFLEMNASRKSKNALVQWDKMSGVEQVFNSLLSSLDAHSALLTSEAYNELKQGTEGEFGGLGILVGIKNRLLTVVRPLPRSPAERAGLKNDDRILSINGQKTFGFDLDDLVQYMRGAPGTNVQLSFLRKNHDFPAQLTLKREIIQLDSVDTKPLKNSPGILHITIDSFSARTSREVLNAINDFRRKNDGIISGLIIDLRSNPGGLLDQAVQVADLFIDNGAIVRTKGRHEEVESATKGYEDMNFPITLLINGDSASASEIVAGAMQDHDRAIVIGQPSFGKGSVQTIFELPGFRALKLTIARYYTPSGRTIQSKGIMPDIWLQPVIERKENMNLLGFDHYKNEMLLHNKLQSREIIDHLADNHDIAKVTGYYLTPEDLSAEETPADHELDMAVNIIKKVNSVYGNQLPDGTMRSGHWLALASDVVKEQTGKLSNQTSDWLQKQFTVNWSPSLIPEKADSLTMEVGRNSVSSVKPGDRLQIPITLKNSGSAAVERISVFAYSDNVALQTTEMLIGRINPNQTLNLTLPIEIPTAWPKGFLKLTVGAASGARTLDQLGQQATVFVEQRKTPTLDARISLSNESKKSDGALEPGETATLKVEIENTGKVSADQLKIKLYNLSGRQINSISSSGDEKSIPSLTAQTKTIVAFDVSGGSKIVNPELDFGIEVQSKSLERSFSKTFVLKAKVAKKVPQQDLYSH